jgi:hypothetical protein
VEKKLFCKDGAKVCFHWKPICFCLNELRGKANHEIQASLNNKQKELGINLN